MFKLEVRLLAFMLFCFHRITFFKCLGKASNMLVNLFSGSAGFCCISLTRKESEKPVDVTLLFMLNNTLLILSLGSISIHLFHKTRDLFALCQVTLRTTPHPLPVRAGVLRVEEGSADPCSCLSHTPMSKDF